MINFQSVTIMKLNNYNHLEDCFNYIRNKYERALSKGKKQDGSRCKGFACNQSCRTIINNK